MNLIKNLFKYINRIKQFSQSSRYITIPWVTDWISFFGEPSLYRVQQSGSRSKNSMYFSIREYIFYDK